MSSILIRLCCQKFIGSIRGDYTTSEGHVPKDAMKVEWVPQGGVDDMPDISKISALLIDPGRRHHEANP